jgi:proline dehydrogenase
MAIFRNLLGRSLPLVPKPIVRRVARRYVAGETLADASARARELNGRGLVATLALLGEEVTDRDRAKRAVDEYVELIEKIRADRLRSGLSIKLTLLGLKIDEQLCRDNLFEVAAAARTAGLFVRIDMEDHTCTDATLRLYHAAQGRYGNLGVVLQAYLRRTLADIAALEPGTSVRLCKGIYIEPPEVAHRDPEVIRESFVACLQALLARGCHVGIATHDDRLADRARTIVGALGLGEEAYEFQTLLGVREELRDRLRAEGHRVRVYVPYGADWYLYSIRRLRENPKIAVYVLRAFLGLR